MELIVEKIAAYLGSKIFSKVAALDASIVNKVIQNSVVDNPGFIIIF